MKRFLSVGLLLACLTALGGCFYPYPPGYDYGPGYYRDGGHGHGHRHHGGRGWGGSRHW